MSDEERFERYLRDAAREYHRPPETPRDVMWERIAAARARRASHRPVRSPQGRWWLVAGLAAAAVLALGIGIGRYSARVRSPVTASVGGAPAMENGNPDTRVAATAYQVAALQHLQQVETFLAVFRADASSPRDAQAIQASKAARQLLQNTRLLMDSPAATDPRLRSLLDDVELVLAQIASYAGEQRHAEELQLIDQGLRDSDLLSKLRSAVPAEFSAARAQGVL